MRIAVLPAVLAVAVVALAQDPAAPAPTAGPAIAFADAFPGQEPFDRPLFVAFTPADVESAYVVVQPGQVFRVPRDPAAKTRTTLLDLADVVFLGHNEEGLLGFAFDPAYAENGFVYACWTEKTPPRTVTMPSGVEAESRRQSVVSRWHVVTTAGVPQVDRASELRVLEVFQPWGNHNGGTIVFGPDGMLYVALGDGGAANDPHGSADRLQNLLGKVLRLDVRGAAKEKPYAIPADNPFVGKDGACGEIWCYGLRNPWRIAFDRTTGDLWCGDVGQDRIEEVDRLVKGGFYGWNAWEASERFARRLEKGDPPTGEIPPIAEYPHSLGLSVTGGHVYRGAAFPGLTGFYVYGDFATKRMWAVREDRGGGKHVVVTLNAAPLPPSSFAEEPDGELLVTVFDGKNGKVLRIVPAAAK